MHTPPPGYPSFGSHSSVRWVSVFRSSWWQTKATLSRNERPNVRWAKKWFLSCKNSRKLKAVSDAVPKLDSTSMRYDDKAPLFLTYSGILSMPTSRHSSNRKNLIDLTYTDSSLRLQRTESKTSSRFCPPANILSL